MMNDEKKSKYFFITGHFFITVLRVLLVQKKEANKAHNLVQRQFLEKNYQSEQDRHRVKLSLNLEINKKKTLIK